MRYLGEYLSELVQDHINWTGVEVVVQPGASRAKEGVRAFRTMCLVEPSQARDIAMLRVMGSDNMSNADLIVFTFNAGSGVHELDEIEWGGYVYKLENGPSDTLQSVEINRRCLATRLRKL